MNASSISMANRPLTAKELTDRANDFEWNPLISLKYWVRAAETILKEGEVYLREGNIAQAYVVLYRYSTLVLEYLTKHPEARSQDGRGLLKPLNKRIPKVMDTLERLKQDIEESYDRWNKLAKAEKDAARNRRPPSSHRSPYEALDPALSWNYSSPRDILDARDHKGLAVDLARREMQRRRGGASSDDDPRRRRDSNQRPLPTYDEELQRQMEATRQQLNQSRNYTNYKYEEDDYVPSTTYSYPSINKSSPFTYQATPPTLSPRSELPPPLAPTRPPKELPKVHSGVFQPPPPRPDKKAIHPSTIDDFESVPVVNDAPALPPKTKIEQPRITFRADTYLENGKAIRTVFLPRNLRHKFLNVAAKNTAQGLEMCGVLCGIVHNNALFITHLLIPDQTCTPNTCDTDNEEDIWQFCHSRDLFVMGWIHTHPTQTCFLSSRDQHTQSGYQVQLPESIAIVCAPKFEPSWGVFRLTDPPGLPVMLECRRTETFHEHDCRNPYVEALAPSGHVYEEEMDFEVCDLRHNRKG
ncbi:hypothetical protein QBC35DRAFT_392192 [Podospora australis]|uniref:MPN domain-containing protein n=1 Tax=Podospora australis TaxID=1536484 RepID=A0AAN7AEF9_9PEZI|nr:hypothetical protein QBC35DRAFT_392192 [Podospora australis]